MFIKTLRHKTNSIHNLLTYMRDGMAERDFSYAHNLMGSTLREYADEFIENDRHRSNHAKTRWYHEILSLGAQDKEKVTTKMLEQLAHKYIQLRNDKALVYSVAHTGDEHVHIHFAFSGVEFGSSKTLRMDDQTFLNLRMDMEAYQMRMFPELVHSIVYHNREHSLQKDSIQIDRNARKQRACQREQRTKTISDKQRCMDIVQQSFDLSTTLKAFYTALENEGLELYTYRGKVKGVIANRKYRFATLGITKEMLLSLDRFRQREQEIEQLMNRDDIQRSLKF